MASSSWKETTFVDILEREREREREIKVCIMLIEESLTRDGTKNGD